MRSSHLFIKCNFQGGEERLKCELPQQKNQNNNKETTNPKETDTEMEYKPTMKDFMITMKRLLMNPILAYNNLSSIFFILGAAGHFTFMSKYVEVVFGVSAADNSMISGTSIQLCPHLFYTW